MGSMSGDHPEPDPKNLPVPWTARPDADIEHHRSEWSSGTRGGGHVPKSFTWATNPKEHQEEFGASEAEAPISK